MDRRTAQLRKRLAKRAKKGFRGYPIGTIACYGPDDRRATKLLASIVEHDGAEPSEMRKWYAEDGDVRDTLEIMEETVGFLEHHGVRSVVIPDRIIGCPHEEGIDYEGQTCPQCPFWANRDRWTGQLIH
jgi:hypothetical protein